MEQIRTRSRRTPCRPASPRVDVGILDSGIDGNHLDFMTDGGSNVDCARGPDSAVLRPAPASATPPVRRQPLPRHARGRHRRRPANGIGVVGVAPNVDARADQGLRRRRPLLRQRRRRGHHLRRRLQLDVINMSFFVDDDEFQQSTEFKCSDDPTQRAFRTAVERALAVRPQPGRHAGRGARQLRPGPRQPGRRTGQPIGNMRGRAGRDERRHRHDGARPGPEKAELLELRHRRGRRRGARRQRHDRRLHARRSCRPSRQRLRLLPGHVDGLAARGRRRGADRQPVRHGSARTAT